MIKYIKNELKHMPATVMIFVLLYGIVTLATNYLFNSNQVQYDNTTSGIHAGDVQGAIDELYACATGYEEIKASLYPVGSIYISTSSANPSTIFGGTWESFGQGRTIVGVGTGTDANSLQKVFASNETGGEYSHTLTVNEMPSHKHEWESPNYNFTTYDFFGAAINASGGNVAMSPYNRYQYSDIKMVQHAAGGNQPHSIVQPYITVYMWKRTA